MSRLDAVPYSKVADAPADLRFGCPVCDAQFAAKDGQKMFDTGAKIWEIRSRYFSQ